MAHDLSVSEQLTYSTVRIEASLEDGGTSVGTGFFFRFLENGDRHVPAVVTNKHVVTNASAVSFLVHEADSGGSPDPTDNTTVSLGGEDMWIKHPDPNIDLCILPTAQLITAAQNQGKTLFYISLDASLIPTEEESADLTAIEDVVMVGYPVGIWDSANNMPVVRRGITATHPAKYYEGRDEFMIDAACFPGSSGSPVFLFNLGSYPKRTGGIVIGTRIKLLGVLHAGPQYTASGVIRIVDVPTARNLVSSTAVPTNLGLCIKSERLRDFDDILRAHA